ncbi:VanZ family protein [Marinicella litoralis]|uniref:VanZ like protein n=1 Tax=Marinicella litoralis TaxID=644220 RepID=A0A4R6XZM9_9GAMM|nr:VanZ family protein [Marinicella litoralis]TDR23804.1 hypothetical protein C8D91_0670 [Marinicella litoralis]
MNKHTVIKLLAWAMLITLVILSLVRVPQVSSSIENSDKLLHLGSYFILTFWFLHAYPKRIIWVTCGLVVLGGLLEYLQSLTAYRFTEWLDFWMNLTGVLLAVLLFSVFKRHIKFLMTR